MHTKGRKTCSDTCFDWVQPGSCWAHASLGIQAACQRQALPCHLCRVDAMLLLNTACENSHKLSAWYSIEALCFAMSYLNPACVHVAQSVESRVCAEETIRARPCLLAAGTEQRMMQRRHVTSQVQTVFAAGMPIPPPPTAKKGTEEVRRWRD